MQQRFGRAPHFATAYGGFSAVANQAALALGVRRVVLPKVGTISPAS
jgi:hypothetical protein